MHIKLNPVTKMFFYNLCMELITTRVDAWLCVIWVVVYGKPQIEKNDLAKHLEDDSTPLNGYIVSN